MNVRRHPLSPHQQAVLDAYRCSNIVVDAVPGAGKTFLLTSVAHDCQAPTLFVAHTKRAATEVATLLPEWAKSRTMHSVGLALWHRLVPGAEFREDKSAALCKYVCDGNNSLRMRWRSWGAVHRLLTWARTLGIVPAGTPGMTGLIADSDESWFVAYEAAEIDSALRPEDLFTLTRDALRLSIKTGRQVDHDALYLSTLTDDLRGMLPKPKYILVDEAQDLEPLQRRLIERIVNGGARLVAVGDPRQSIFSWRGADRDAMEKLRASAGAVRLTLPVSYRLPRLVIETTFDYTGWNVLPAPDAIDGEIHAFQPLNLVTLPAGALILCRRRAPLARQAALALRRGRKVRMIGAADGRALAAVLRDAGKGDTALYVAVTAVVRDLGKRARLHKTTDHKEAAATTQDRADTIAALAGALMSKNAWATVADMVAMLGEMYVDELNPDALNFSTIHRAKGAESRYVVIIGLDKLDGDDILVLDAGIPWKEAVLDHPKGQSLLYVVFPDEDSTWRVQTVPLAKVGFDNRKSLPQAWAGLRRASESPEGQQSLPEVTGVEDAIFCHRGRFIAGAVSKEGAIKLAKLAVDNEGN
jgi:hypothetical protein